MADPVGSPVPSLTAPSPSPSPAADADNSKWYIGAIINVVGSVSINLGMNLMKLGHSRRDQLDMPEEEKPPIRTFKVWVIGLICFIVGNVLNFVSFAFAAQSLLAALGSFQLVCNVFFAYFVNHEPVTAVIILSTCCIIGGCVVLVLFGNQSSATYTVAQLKNFYKKLPYIIYLVFMGVFVFGFYLLYVHAKRVCRRRMITEHGPWYVTMLVSYAIYSALLGSQSVLFGKTISTILRTTIQGDNQLGNWYTYVAIVAFLVTALFYVTRMNKGLRTFPAMLIVPVLQIAWTLFSIVSGMLYFQEYNGFTTIKAIMFPVGVLIVFAGVFILTMWGKRRAAELVEAGTPDSSSKIIVHDNAMFNAAPHPDGEPGSQDTAHHHHLQQSKISLGQTLRITSSWAPPSVAVSPSSHMNRTLVANESIQRHRRATVPSDLGTDEAAAWGGSTVAGGNNSTLNRTAQSNMSQAPSETSLLSTMRKSIRSVQSRLTNDLGKETVTGIKLAMGLGDQRLAGVSVFTMPALDFTATQRRARVGSAPAHVHEAAILRALPKSKFPRWDLDPLDTIQETTGAMTLKPTASETVPSLTASSQLPPSSHGGESAPTARTGGSPPEGSRRSALPRAPTATPLPPRSPLAQEVLQDMLPGPAFKVPSGRQSEVINATDGRPRSAPVGGSGTAGPRLGGAGATSNAPEGSGRLPLSSFRPSSAGRGPGGLHPEGPTVQVASGGRAIAGSWGTVLPDGVPLSTTNSVVVHESRPGTPPDQMLVGAGPSGTVHGAYSLSPSLWRQHTPPPAQPQYQYPPSVRSSHHYNAPTVPLSMRHWPAGAQDVGGVRLPPLHLVVPGMPVQPGYTAQQQQQYPVLAGRASAYQPASMSYVQLLATQMQAHASNGGGNAAAQVFNQAGSFEGPPPGSGAMTWQSRPPSPHGLSISRSWMDRGPGGQTGAQHLPVRGGLLSYLQRPLRPWHD